MLFTTTLSTSAHPSLQNRYRSGRSLGLLLLLWLLPLVSAWAQSNPVVVVQGALAEPATVTFPRAQWGMANKYILAFPHQSCGNLTGLRIEARLDTGPDHAFSTSTDFTTAMQVTVTVSSTGGGVTPSNFKANLAISQTQPEHWRLLDASRFLGANSAANDLKVTVSVPNPPTITGADPGTQRIIVRCVPQYQTYAPATLTVTPATPPAVSGYEQTLSWGSACSLVENYQIQLLFRPVLVVRVPATPEVTSTDASYRSTNAPTPGEWLQASSLIETGSAALAYKLTLAEGEGTYHWRVRAVGNQPGGSANPANWGPWANGAAFTVTAAPDAASNWIYSRSFSEGGHVAEKLTFANGLQQVQQSQTRLATPTQPSTQLGQQVVATQTVQDFAGRDALTSLPIPLQGAGAGALGFRPKLLTRLSGTVYDAGAFDETDQQPGATKATNTAREPQQAQEQGYYKSGNDRVADAEGYPFTRTIFSNDGTNRVVEQGGVGAALRVQQTSTEQHTVRTSYVSVAPQEVIRLFGREAPQTEGLYKIVTTDPNNVSSITYQAKDGKTIATALSGGNDSFTAPLQNLSSAGINRAIKEVITGKGQIISKTLTLTEGLTLQYSYKLTPAQLQSACTANTASSYCSSCDYQVLLRIIDVNAEPGNGVVYTDNYVVRAAEQCAVGSIDVATNKPVTLAAGTYRIERELVPVDYYSLPAGVQYASSPSTTTRTLTEHLVQLRDKLNNAVTGGVWDVIKTHLASGTEDVDGLYRELANPSYNLTTETRDGQLCYKIPIPGCDAVYFPLLTDYCPACNLATADFEGQLAAALNKLNEQYTANQHTVAELLTASGYAAGELNQLAANMAAPALDPIYKCEDVQNCWQSILAGMEGMLYLNSGLPAAYKYDIVREFLQCTGLRMKTPVATPAKIDPTRAFEQFSYTANDAQNNCFNSQNITAATFSAATPEIRANVYACIQFMATAPTTRPTKSPADAQAQADMLTQQGQQVCETRRDEFRRVLVLQLHQQGLYVEGDVYIWTPGANNIPTITSTLIPFDTPFIPVCEIESLTQSLVDQCRGDAKVSVNYAPDGSYQIGTETERDKLKQAMFSTMSLSINNASCPTSWQPVTQSSTPSSKYDISQTTKEFLRAVGTLTEGANRLTSSSTTHSLLGCSGQLNTLNEKQPNVFSFSASFSDWSFGNSCPAVGEPFEAMYGTILDDRQNRVTGGARFTSATDYLLITKRGGTLNDACSPLASSGAQDAGCDVLSDILETTGHHYVFAFAEPATGKRIPKAEIRAISEPYINFFGQADLNTSGFQGIAVRILRQDPANRDGITTWQEVALRVAEENIGESNTDPAAIGKTVRSPASCTPTTVTSMCYQWSVRPTGVSDPEPGYPVYNPQPEPCNVMVARRLRVAFEADLGRWVESQVTAFTAHFQQQCVALATQQEEFTINYRLGYHHFTLYYYDRAGNLMKTIPPAGVVQLTDAQVATCLGTADRAAWPVPLHKLPTTYLYNSLHQLEEQVSPDGGKTRFFYNRKGQLRFSQNARQRLASQPSYSYTRYDALGRVTEVGETFTGATGDGVTIAQELLTPRARAEYMNYPPLDEVRQVTRTVYGDLGSVVSYRGQAQRYLTNRVAYSCYDVDGNPASTDDNSYTYYSYDPHGNVEWLGQAQPRLGSKFVRYEYDLVSNKVTQVLYQEGQPDQFYHRYNYDADNRLTQVQTSVDGSIWDQDARYTYFAHGPLKRLEVGEDHVQGLDYTYTIQGWLKGLNHPGQDPGQDGSATDLSASGKDAFGMALGYFTGDFKTDNSAWTTGTGSVLQPEYSLYNGNIAAWTSKTRNDLTSLGLTTSTGGAEGERYRYDQLNRLKRSSFFASTSTATLQATDDYGTSYSYDPNGNLQTLRRDGSASLGQLSMDFLSYRYDTQNGRANRLLSVIDPVEDQPYYDDIKLNISSDPQYGYDAIGNLISDASSGAATTKNIEWNVYGKISQVTQPNSLTATYYGYDAQGNRIHKGFTNSDGDVFNHVYYVRDASGNVLAVYEQRETSGRMGPIALTEQPIYGSSRLGLRKPSTPPTGVPTEYFQRVMGQKQYELTDHLGNVRALVSDIKRPDTGGTYKPDLLAYYNYYPFGMMRPGQAGQPVQGNATLAGGYRYGFNGKEKDNNGELGLTTYDYGFRIYNPGIGRFLSVDPLTRGYPMLTPYQFASNRPIQMIDLDGLEGVVGVAPVVGPTIAPMPLGTSQSPTGEYGAWVRNRTKVRKNDPHHIIETDITGGLLDEPLEYASYKLTFGVLYNYGFNPKNAIIFTDDPRTLSDDYLATVRQRSEAGEVLSAQERSYLTEAYSRVSLNTKNSNLLEETNRMVARFKGLKDRKTGDIEVRTFGSRVKGTNRPDSDLDVLILVDDSSLFTQGQRLSNIVDVIRKDFKSSTGVDLDVNIMSRDDYRRQGSFKDDVDKTSKKH